jgi:hypothetical protein
MMLTRNDPANAVHLARNDAGNPAMLDILARSAGNLGRFIIDGRSLLFRDVHCTAAQDGSAGSCGSEFRKGHTNGHGQALFALAG